MGLKKYCIKKGNHSASGFNFGITFKKTIKFRASFTESCLYDLGSNDNYDINKLYGFSTTIFHHNQSARIGWRCIDGENIEVLTYSYNNKKRSLLDSNLLATVKPNQWFNVEITDHESYYEYKLTYENDLDNDNIVVTDKDKKEKDWFLFHYFLYPYFGGNKPAPHNMLIYIEKI